ncbi:hypothetical protein, partial [Treponema endosymbiont of Eucomonympha sp.]|uniref:hypothetical protein n=1 Tax=Treponema endosymbiont of Eucomonympha sp. TaxID=1580831 RepID=UPI001EE71B86
VIKNVSSALKRRRDASRIGTVPAKREQAQCLFPFIDMPFGNCLYAFTYTPWGLPVCQVL